MTLVEDGSDVTEFGPGLLDASTAGIWPATDQPLGAREGEALSLIRVLSSLPLIEEVERLFAPPVPVPEAALPLDHSIGLTWRVPAWPGTNVER